MDEKINYVDIFCFSKNVPCDKNSEVLNGILQFRNDFMKNINCYTKMSSTKKAKRIRFFRNGDKFYNGIVIAVTPERYRSFDSLISDLTRALISNVNLPNGVRIVYSMDGKKIQNINDLEDGKSYVVSGQNEIFKKIDYSSNVKRGNSLTGLPSSPAINLKPIITLPISIKAKIITLVRNGTKPRKIIRLLLNKRNSASIEHVFKSITEVIKLDSGAVRKVYSLSGQQITNLEQMFSNNEIFIVYGIEKINNDDFELDSEELKCVQSFRKGHCSYKKDNGPMPKMPARKINKRLLNTMQTRNACQSTVIYPNSIRLHYNIGDIIGDGNFAVVRHCLHKLVRFFH